MIFAILLLIQQNMRREERKNSKKVAFSSTSDIAATDEVQDKLLSFFEAHDISLESDRRQGSCKSIESEENEGTASIKTFKSFRKEGNCRLSDLQRVLLRQLGDSLAVIENEMYGDPSEETDTKLAVKVLLILYRFLDSSTLNEQNSSKMLRWIYTLTAMNTFELCMELSNVVTSIKKKLLKLGFFILERFKKVDCSNLSHDDEEEFKLLVSNLIRSKEKEVDQFKYEMCRLCEIYVPLNKLPRHLIECERSHQIRYHQSKIQEKGNEILSFISKLDPGMETQKMEELFSLLFQTFGGKNVLFKFKSEPEMTKDFIQKCEEYDVPTFNSLLEIVKKYKDIFENSSLRSLSDKDSHIKSKRKIVSIRGIGRSSTSLDPDSFTLHHSHSEKTINSETESNGRYKGCRLDDFEVIKKIGRGSYSEVYLVRKKNTMDLFAMKVIEFEDMNEEKMDTFRKEQKIYKSIMGEFNVKLYFSFREENLYFFILDFGCGGNFRTLLEKEVYLEEGWAKTYLANLVLAIESIHALGIIHRDLKPDNIVISEDGHLILTDFNLSKLIKQKQVEKENTFYGTPDYIAPEVIKGEYSNESIDWFSLGVIAYEMIIGVTPFTDFTKEAVFNNILKGEIEWPQAEEDQISPECQDLITKLLNPDPEQRLGCNGASEIKDHPFFSEINWMNIGDNDFFFVPEIPEVLEEDTQLLEYIDKKKKKLSFDFTPSEENIVRYDVLKLATSNIVRERRSSRFKIEKELEDLKPAHGNNRYLRQRSHNNFAQMMENDIRVSCHDFVIKETHNE